MFPQIKVLLHITHSHGILRRYFVVNGFDGALTMLGICMGFYFSESIDVRIVIHACLGAAIALGVSGISSAYISESAEKQKELGELERAMITNLDESHFGMAKRWVPVVTGIVNGAAPFLISVFIILPLWLYLRGYLQIDAPLELSIAIACTLIFMLGIFLGKISGTFWLWSGLKTLIVAVVTVFLVYVISQF